jgi:predicted DNA-binding transcriptional regulator AlpA
MNSEQPPPTALNPGDLLDEREAAAAYGISVQTLRNWRWKGIGPRYRKIGSRSVRYHRDDLTAFIGGDAGKAA